MNDYFQGSINQQLVRGQLLLARIPTELSREFHLLAQTCRNELKVSLDSLRLLLDDSRMLLPIHQPERLRAFRRLIADMNFLETVGIAALERANKTDESLNRLIERIRNEISYPLLPPVVTSLSQQYFHIYPRLNLLCVPLSEEDFLLHLPDLYHELAHPLLFEKYDPRVKSFQNAFLQGLDIALGYVKQEQRNENRRRGPVQITFHLQQWERSWWSWLVEFFCDLFAVYTVGPAFAWAHLHLCAGVGEDPFYVPTISPSSHPADDARMRVILAGLNITGFSKEADNIQRRWQEFVAISRSKPEPEYRRCFTQDILEDLAKKAFEGVSGMGCRVAIPGTDSPVCEILNQAWVKFWQNPDTYTAWERDAVVRLRELH